MITLYHRVMRRENFETVAKDLFDMLQAAQQKNPNEPRALFLDIDGHRNEQGGFDQDMFELQRNFILEFLMPFFKEVHMPLGNVVNTKEQCNDIPDSLKIFNAKNKQDSSIHELYIENYSNTEFISEPEVYTFMKKVSVFLREYNDMDIHYALEENEAYDSMGWMKMWRTYIKNLINELFASFTYGNYLSVTAMTRTLMESYVYWGILKKEKSAELLSEWYLCSTIRGIRKFDEEGKTQVKNLVKKFCILFNKKFDETWDKYTKKGENENSWLKIVIPKKRVSFRDACEFLDESEIYHDYETTSAFVHGHDITSKLSPFAFYISIYHKLYLMMFYIFKSIRLCGINEEMEEKIQDLELELIELEKIAK